MGTRNNNQSLPPVTTDEFKSEDESLTTNKAAAVMPLLVGEGKTTLRWLSPIYGQRVVEIKTSSGGGKGSSKGGSSGSTEKEYHGTVAGAIGEGPAYSLEWIIIGGKTVYQGQLLKPAGDVSNLTLTGMGSARFYWGTETQTADSKLLTYATHPGYRGLVYLVLDDVSWGNSTGPLTVEVGWRRQAQQSITAGYGDATDGNATAVPTATAAEMLTSWSWGNVSAAKINATSFQTLAQALQTETIATTNRYRTSIAALYNEQATLRDALGDISSVAKTWLRTGVDGKIEAGYWKRDGSVSGVAALTYNDVDSAKFKVDPIDTLPNSFTVTFRDASKHHKANCLSTDNTASIRNTGLTRQQSVDQTRLLIWDDQAHMHGTDLLRDASLPLVTITLQCRRWKAVNVGGTPIRPGDYFTFPINEVGDAADVRLFRCVRRSFDPTGPIELTGELETNGAVRNVTPAVTPVFVAPVMPPVNYSRVLATATQTPDDQPCVSVFAARPTGTAQSCAVEYCASLGGDFAYIGTQFSFCLPMNLYASLSSGASTIRLQLITGTNGVDPRRDSGLLLNWNGGAGEAANDQLLICVIKKDGSGNVVYQSGGAPWVEFLSVSGPPSAVTTDVYDVPVLRSRRGTPAAAFSTGSFPDAWSTYEAWIVPSTAMEAFTHIDFAAQIVTQAAAYFHLIATGSEGVYDPTAAYAERVRRVSASLTLQEFFPQATGGVFYPAITYTMPPFRLPSLFTSSRGASGFTPVLNGIIDQGGGTFMKTGGTNGNWDAQVYGAESYAGGCFVTFSPGQASGYAWMIGLNTDPATDASYTSIDYAWHHNGSVYQVYESGVGISTFGGTPSTADVLQITYDGAQVRYIINGVVMRSVPVLITAPLFLDSSFATTYGTVKNLKFGPMASANLNAGFTPVLTNITNSGNGRFIKTGGTNATFDSQVYSTESYAGGCFVTFSTDDVTKSFMVGLSLAPATDATETYIDYAWYLHTTGKWYFCESGVARVTTYTAATTDVLQITYDGAQIRYILNGVIKRTVPIVITAPISLDSSFYNTGAAATALKFGPMGMVGTGQFTAIARGQCIDFGAGNFGKTSGSVAWDSDVYSLDAYSGGAFASASVAVVAGTDVLMFGLNSDPLTNQSYTSLDFAFFCAASGGLYIYESNVPTASLGTYTAADILAIVYDGASVKYTKNGTVVRTITASANLTLSFDSSFNYVSATLPLLRNVRFGPSGSIGPNGGATIAYMSVSTSVSLSTPTVTATAATLTLSIANAGIRSIQFNGYVGLSTGSAGSTQAITAYIYKDGSLFYTFPATLIATFGAQTPFALACFDSPAIGSHTYDLRLSTAAAGPNTTPYAGTLSIN